MRSFFSLDNPFMIFLSRLTDLIVLNVVCLICCLPIVTIGASLTALHYVTLKMAKDEEGYILKDFFASFKRNFKQATVIWISILVIIAVFLLDRRIIIGLGAEIPKVVTILIYTIFIFVMMTAMYVFPVLSRFENSSMNTVKNAFLMSVLHFPKTILMAVIYILPTFISIIHIAMFPVFLMLGLTGGAYMNSYIWKGIFKKYEPEEISGEVFSEVEGALENEGK